MGRRALLQAGALSLAVLPPNQARAAEPALNVQRFSLSPTITPLGILGGLSQYDDQISLTKTGTKALSLNVQFEFPSQWAQLQRQNSITLVDQSTGLKMYVLKAPLPEGTTLATVPKAWFGESVFSPEGAIVTSGTVIEDYKVSSSKVGEVPEFKLTLKDSPEPFALAPGQSSVRSTACFNKSQWSLAKADSSAAATAQFRDCALQTVIWRAEVRTRLS